MHIVRGGRHPAVGSHVHGQRERYGDTFGNTGCGHQRARTRSRSPPRTWCHSYRHPDLHPHGRPGVPDHQPCRAPPSPSARPGPLPSRRPGCPTCTLSERAHCRRESRSRTTGTARRQLREHRLRAPAEHTRSRSPPRTVSVLPPPSPSPSRSTGVPDHQPCRRHLCRRPGRDLYRHVDRGAHCALSETGKLPTGVTFTDNGNGTATIAGTPAADTGGHTRSRSPPRTVSVPPPRPSPSRSTRRARSPAPATTTLPSARPGPLPSRRPGRPRAHCPRRAHCRRELTFTDNGDGTATISGTPTRPAARTRSRSPPRTVSVLPPPRPSPSRSTRRRRPQITSA